VCGEAGAGLPGIFIQGSAEYFGEGTGKAVKPAASQPSFGAHENIRGGQYYVSKEEGHA
jgi:hypothetical protein